MRICPVCSVPLKIEELHNKTIDRCPECKGIYFDKGELESIIEIVKLFTDADLKEREIETIPLDEQSRELKCPVDGVIMNKNEIGGIVIDVCPDCGGIWLDSNEIAMLKIAENSIKDNLNLYIRLGS